MTQIAEWRLAEWRAKHPDSIGPTFEQVVDWLAEADQTLKESEKQAEAYDHEATWIAQLLVTLTSPGEVMLVLDPFAQVFPGQALRIVRRLQRAVSLNAAAAGTAERLREAVSEEGDVDAAAIRKALGLPENDPPTDE